jgi:prepilin-type N-terminal cleavage/methylation domain-containing protein
MNRIRSFTLIELLIVVAIIAVLAAIAVPNFLEAQTRAKVSRVKADLRTLVTAVEAYHIDTYEYPPHLQRDGTEIGYPDRYVPLTTPIAYISTLPAREIFYSHDITGQGGSLEWYSWTNFASFPDTHALHPAVEVHRWMLRSRGPDTENESNAVRNAFFNGGIAAAPSMLYDPTNGTTSRGDIVRSHAVSDP